MSHPAPMIKAVTPSIGQIWLDVAKLNRNRLLKIKRVDGRFVFTEVVRDDDKPELIGSEVRANITRFAPYCDGYRLWAYESGKKTFEDEDDE